MARVRKMDARAAEKRGKALELMLAGATYAQIAETVGYPNKGLAHRAVMQELKAHAAQRDELAGQAREIVIGRMDRLWGSYYTRAVDGDHKAADLCVRLLDRYARLHGLDAPVKVDATVTTRTELDAELEQLVATLTGRTTTAAPTLTAAPDPIDAETVDEPVPLPTRSAPCPAGGS